MKYLQAIVVEDEPQNRILMETFIKNYCPTVKVIASCGTFDQAQATLRTTKADILFLDIRLDKGTSLDLLDNVDIGSTQIIFITAHKDYATQVFRFNTTDYLLKPLQIEDLIAAVHRATLRIEKEEFLKPKELKEIRKDTTTKTSTLDVIPIANIDKVNFIKINEVLYCKSSGRYTEFHLVNNRLLVASKPLGSYEKLLGTKNFFRVHNSYLVNLSHLIGITRKGGAYCEMSTGFLIPISRRKFPALTQHIAKG